MDFTFLLVSFFLVVFLIISYLLDVIKLSSPLILIYLVFCFTYLIDTDGNQKTISRIDEARNDEDLNFFSQEVDPQNVFSEEELSYLNALK